MTRPDLTRRTFAGAAVLGAAVPLLAACGGEETTTGSSDPSPTPTEEPTASPSESPSGGGSGGEPLVATSEVPVNGGVVVEGADVVVVQPAEGEFRCFTAVCTHQGCLVGSVADNQIVCPCHNSVFSAEDGSVVNGPATEPLEEVAVQVADGQVTRA